MASKHFKIPGAFKISYDGIDAEHEALVDIVNSCLDQCIDGKLQDFGPLINTLLGCMEDHFHNEEEHMQSVGYSGLEWHQIHHADCCDRLRTVIEGCHLRGFADANAINNLFDDIIHDVARADLKFREFLEDKGLIA